MGGEPVAAVLAIPPLRERPDEIEALARAFAADAAKRLGRSAPPLSAEALAALQRHPWTGNLRELRTPLARAVLLAGDAGITVAELTLSPASAGPRSTAPSAAPPPSTAPATVPTAAAPLPEQLAALERERIVNALAECQGNQTRAAAMLGMPLRTLVKRLTQYGVARPRKR